MVRSVKRSAFADLRAGIVRLSAANRSSGGRLRRPRLPAALAIAEDSLKS